MTDRIAQEALTFDDVLLLPAYSDVLPTAVDTSTRLTRRLKLQIPFLSAAMDTVTEATCAITMAQEGGIGVIHKNMTVDQQVAQVRLVKKFESGIIHDPITIDPEQPLHKAVELMRQNAISGIPVVRQAKLVGILTNRDLRFERNLDQPVSAVMTTTLITAPEGIAPEQAKDILHKHKIEKLLVVDGQGNLKGLITIKDLQKAARFPTASKDEHGCLLVAGAVGVGSKGMERMEALLSAGCDLVCIDTAHGFSKSVIDTLKQAKAAFKQAEIMAGNVATADGCLALIQAGADAVKVGIGPGSICTTRVVAGVGVPQITAVMDCALAATPHRVPIIADGGIKFSGDVAKAIAAGASAVMIGSMLAGTEESPGEVVLYQGRSYKVYRGMGSLGAMKAGSKDRYFQDNVQQTDKLVPEGIEGRVPYRGPLSGVLHQLVGGLRAGMGYCGCGDIEQMRARPRFVRISQAGLTESHVHDVIITKEAPNYRVNG